MSTPSSDPIVSINGQDVPIIYYRGKRVISRIVGADLSSQWRGQSARNSIQGWAGATHFTKANRRNPILNRRCFSFSSTPFHPNLAPVSLLRLRIVPKTKTPLPTWYQRSSDILPECSRCGTELVFTFPPRTEQETAGQAGSYQNPTGIRCNCFLVGNDLAPLMYHRQLSCQPVLITHER